MPCLSRARDPECHVRSVTDVRGVHPFSQSSAMGGAIVACWRSRSKQRRKTSLAVSSVAKTSAEPAARVPLRIAATAYFLLLNVVTLWSFRRCLRTVIGTWVRAAPSERESFGVIPGCGYRKQAYFVNSERVKSSDRDCRSYLRRTEAARRFSVPAGSTFANARDLMYLTFAPR